MVKLLSGQGSSVLFLLPSEEVVFAFLWSVFDPGLSVAPIRFILQAQTKPTFPTNASAAFQGQASDCWEEETTEEEHGSCEDREARDTYSFTHPDGLWKPPALSTVPPEDLIQAHLMNTPALIQSDNGALHCHWAGSQWGTSLQLNPRDNDPG